MHQLAQQLALSTTAIGEAIVEAAGLTADQAKGHIVSPNFTQNIVLVSTPDSDLAESAGDVACKTQGKITYALPNAKFCGEAHPTALTLKKQVEIKTPFNIERKKPFQVSGGAPTVRGAGAEDKQEKGARSDLGRESQRYCESRR
ncbi:hypothetical protein HPB52_021967 [Rhipicephalus sanguineus]|uniref:Uncharacterized protein n=1 Tax=Rhipicephalus sanguineus TaxID=34632 RepID=A0A9D4PL45_RHISA|nr:hypothetical protein HPB52_021967 [Rhipicephalus sanguineus]